jgi:hypothetical protein
VDELLGVIGALLPVTLVRVNVEPIEIAELDAAEGYSSAREILAGLPVAEIEGLRRACARLDEQAASEIVYQHADLAALLAPLFQSYRLDLLERLLP